MSFEEGIGVVAEVEASVKDESRQPGGRVSRSDQLLTTA